MSAHDGGPAFPVVGAPGAPEDYPGASRRDLFAGLVLASLVGRGNDHPRRAPVKAVEFADALLAVLDVDEPSPSPSPASLREALKDARRVLLSANRILNTLADVHCDPLRAETATERRDTMRALDETAAAIDAITNTLEDGGSDVP